MRPVRITRRSVLLGGAASLLTSGAAAETITPITVGMVKSNGVRHVNVTEAQTLIARHPEIIILDVRTPREFRRGHIEGAININYYALSFRKQIRALDRNKTYLIQCRSGKRSGWAAAIMNEYEFNHLVHLDGGFNAWKAEGYPQVKG